MTAPLGLQGQKIGSATNQNFATAANVYGVEVLLAAALRINANVPVGTGYPIALGKIVSFENAIYPTTDSTTIVTPPIQLFPSTWVKGQVYCLLRCHINGMKESGAAGTFFISSDTVENGGGQILFNGSVLTGPMVPNTSGSLFVPTRPVNANRWCLDQSFVYGYFSAIAATTAKYFDVYLYGIVYP